MAISLRLNTRRQITIATSTRLPPPYQVRGRNDRLKRVCVRPACGIKRELRRQVSWSVVANVAAPPGFEPGLTAPKADVLPLHHGALRAGVVIPPYAVHLRPYIVRPVPGVVKAAPPPSQGLSILPLPLWERAGVRGIVCRRIVPYLTPSPSP